MKPSSTESSHRHKRPREDAKHLQSHKVPPSSTESSKVVSAKARPIAASWYTSDNANYRSWHGSSSAYEGSLGNSPYFSSIMNTTLPPRTNSTYLDEISPLYGGIAFTSPDTFSAFDEYAANPRFVELQEELRSILFTGVQSLAPSRAASPGEVAETNDLGARERLPQISLNLSRTSIPLRRQIDYLKVWVSECAPWLDMFDASRHFGIQVPIMAQESSALLYSILALSARQVERKQGLEGSYDSIQLYQESISSLAPILEAKDPNVLVTACILCCLEMMSVSPRDWRRHMEGCAALFESFNVNGFSGGLLQSVFWCYARMDLCGAIISDGSESTVLQISKWVELLPNLCPTSSEDSDGSRPTEISYRREELRDFRLAPHPPQDTVEQIEERIKRTFISRGRLIPDMHANYAVYLCAKTCDLVCRRTRYLELNEQNSCSGANFYREWVRLWEELQDWMSERPPEMLPIRTKFSDGSARDKGQLFPEVFYAHYAAISGNQLYHTACIMILEIKPEDLKLQMAQSCNSPVWHARRVCGISLTNPHRGCLNNAIQPLYVAGKLLSHRSEHVAIVKLIRNIEKTTGWGACWRLKDLERAWGYEPNELESIR